MLTSSEATARTDRRRLFLGCPIDLLTMQDTVDMIDAAIARGEKIQHVVVNVAKLIASRGDPELRQAIASADIINVDGMGVVWGARMCGVSVPERVTGIDLMCALLQRCAEKGYRTYFLGSRRETLSDAIGALRRRYPELTIAGYRDGYFNLEREAAVVEEIRAARSDLLFVGMPSPKKERFISRHFRALGAPFIMGVGGSLDVIANHVERAPLWMQQAGLEWLHRLMQEPRRMWRRYLVTNSVFAGLIVFELCRSLLDHRTNASRRSVT